VTAVEFVATPAVRKAIPLLVGVAGGTGSGKTYSALRLARGLAGDKPFVVIDTENGRALHYADDFAFDHVELTAPFKPSRYAAAIKANEAYPVIVVDSASHSWTGAGGVLEWHDVLERGDAKRKMLAWQEPKADHRLFENELLHRASHVILCFRAAPKVEMRRDAKGNIEVVPKEVIPGRGLDGWLPESDPRLPYEMDCSFLLMADAPGIPKPIKLPDRLRALVPLDEPLSEETGVRLGTWARGDEALPPEKPTRGKSPAPGQSAPTPAGDFRAELAAVASRLIGSGRLSLDQIGASIASELDRRIERQPLEPLLALLDDEQAFAYLTRLVEYERKGSGS
jgi:AAA domain